MQKRAVRIPEAKPAYEYIDGQLYQKVSERIRHGLVQGRVQTLAANWNDAQPSPRGRVWPEGDADIGADRIVPDVCYHRDSAQALTLMDGALEGLPDVVFEVRSPGDEHRIARKKKYALYRRNPQTTVVTVDPLNRSVCIARGESEQTYTNGDVLQISAMPGFAPRAADMFVDLDPDVDRIA